jgi:autotransporter-associated beta strand protein/T5SS/PEP-CTERM-associated repeat protein
MTHDHAPRRARRYNLLPSIVTVALLAWPLVQVQAQTISWVGGTGNFSVSSNWDGDEVPQSFNSIVIGNGGTAQASGSIDVANVTLGTGSSGTLEILPGITSYFTPDLVYVGYSNVGTLSVGAEAEVAAANNVYAGYDPGATGIVNLNGATLSPFTVYFGYGGNATVTLQNGSYLESTTGYVGYAAGSQGVVNLSSSTWKAEVQGTPVDVTVGLDGSGEVQATNSTLSSQNLVLGNGTTATGVVAFSGGNLTIANNLHVGNAGSGNLSLTNSATVTVYAPSVAVLANSTGLLSITNSSLTSTRDVTIGRGGNGTLTTNGAVFRAPDLFLGDLAGATGSATVSGGNMTLSQEIHVGAHGTGTFTLTGGGHLGTDKGNTAFAAGAKGTINILDGTWTNTQAIFVGVSGNGTLNVGADGVIESESGYIAQNAAGVGTVSVAGGSWTMSNTLAVGVNGTGSLSVTNGGTVSSVWSQIGLESGSSGVVTIDDATWTTANTLTISSNGTGGQVFVTNGGNVSAGAIELAASGGVTGSLSVVNSTLTTENIIEGGGTGSVFFSGANFKLLGGPSVIDTLLISGFDPGAVVVGSGGLTVDTQGGNAQIPTALSGNGSLTKVGAGRLRLTAANTYSGGTQVNEGVLEVANDSALAAGNVSVGSAELRASSNTTLSGNLSSGIQLISVSGNQTGTFSAATGQSLTIAPLDFLLVAGSTMRVGSAGNNGTVIFAPTGAVALPADAQLSVDNGTLQAGNGGLIFLADIAESVTVAAGATLDFNDQVSGGAVGNLLGSGTVRIGSQGSSVLAVNSGNFSGSLFGTGNLAKQSSGKLVLSGTNTLTGETTISGGTLQVNGALGDGQVEVQAGGTLGGTGTVFEIVLNGGTLAPGASAGTLTTGDLYWNSGTLLFELGPSSDLLAAGGLQGTADTYFFTFANLGWSAGTTYDLISFTESFIDVQDFAYTNGGGFAGSFAYNNDVLQFTITTVPEPSTWLLIGGTVACLGVLRLRLRHS